MIRTFKVDSTMLPFNTPHLLVMDHDVTLSSTDSETKKNRFSLENSSLRIAYSEQRFELPRDLFSQPRNGALKKAPIPTRLERDGESLFLASGKITTK